MPSHPDIPILGRMERYGVAKGTYEEIIAELNRLGLDALSSGNEAKARRIARAFSIVEAGVQEVRLGDCLYVVSTDRRVPVA